MLLCARSPAHRVPSVRSVGQRARSARKKACRPRPCVHRLPIAISQRPLQVLEARGLLHDVLAGEVLIGMPGGIAKMRRQAGASPSRHRAARCPDPALGSRRAPRAHGRGSASGWGASQKFSAGVRQRNLRRSYFLAGSKYRKSGGGCPFLTGIKTPSPFTQ
jgi:hypothetical protein